ncbi:hypothetical protein F0562_015671 [Nyssa sinensis]|uniref:Remorin C-terminal domain-containing protein n=1 Tax=Nyssa sinensis TaxID=561372 RepID=A0A5J4ZLQ2_9ASTE|nr:hypothetical protein F0562_015671 [Nyssa sinensis]
MLNDQRAITSREDQDHDDDEHFRDIHALTPPHPLPANRGRQRETWETSSHRSSSLSVASEGASIENFTTISREFNALVLAGSVTGNNDGSSNENNLARIGEEEMHEENNPLAMVPDNNLLDLVSFHRQSGFWTANSHSEVSVQGVKKEEVESKISAWQTAKIAKINNRLKRQEAIINGRESEQVQKATSWMKKVERKLEEKRAKALGKDAE